MKIINELELKHFFKARGFKPKDFLGQNFLIDESALDEILKAAELKPSDTVLEVGPGLGILTGELVKTVAEVIAIEKDPKLVSVLKVEFAQEKKLQIINQDILRFHLERNILKDYKVVANIPYYLTSKLFQLFLESSHPPKLMVLMVQKEVGERVVAEAGKLSILGISVQIYADVEIAAQVPSTSFWPKPEVDSVVLKITPKDKYPEIKDKKMFFRIIKVAFAGKRKQLHNSLAHGFKSSKNEIEELLKNAKISSDSRPQELTIEDWIALYKAMDSNSRL